MSREKTQYKYVYLAIICLLFAHAASAEEHISKLLDKNFHLINFGLNSIHELDDGTVISLHTVNASTQQQFESTLVNPDDLLTEIAPSEDSFPTAIFNNSQELNLSADKSRTIDSAGDIKRSKNTDLDSIDPQMKPDDPLVRMGKPEISLTSKFPSDQDNTGVAARQTAIGLDDEIFNSRLDNPSISRHPTSKPTAAIDEFDLTDSIPFDIDPFKKIYNAKEKVSQKKTN